MEYPESIRRQKSVIDGFFRIVSKAPYEESMKWALLKKFEVSSFKERNEMHMEECRKSYERKIYSPWLNYPTPMPEGLDGWCEDLIKKAEMETTMDLAKIVFRKPRPKSGKNEKFRNPY